MNIRTLIQRAIQEARAEFETIVTRRLSELMGDEPGGKSASSTKSAAPRASTSSTSSAKKAPAKKAAAPSPAKKPAAAPPAGGGNSMEEAILRVLASGETLGKSKIMERARFRPTDEVRVSLALGRLRDSGRILMSGQRRGSKYRLRGKGAPAATSSKAAPAKKRAPRAPAKKSAPAAAAPAAQEAEWHPTVIHRRKEEAAPVEGAGAPSSNEAAQAES